MNIENILEKIDADFEKKHLPNIQEFLKQPSVSATGEGIKETTEILMKKISRLGGENGSNRPYPPAALGHDSTPRP